MTLTHDQIAAMTCDEVNKAIAIRQGFNKIRDYCHDWTYAGRLLDGMARHYVVPVFSVIDRFYPSDDEFRSERPNTLEYRAYFDLAQKTISQSGKKLTEAIARFWLEWYEVTHD